MIIRYPTGLFETVLPTNDVAGNVTWLISSTEPPDSPGIFVRIPSVEAAKKRADRAYAELDRRVTIGDLIFTVAANHYPVSLSARKLFEPGQLLDFTEDTPTNLETPHTPDEIIIRHDTNMLELTALGLSDVELAAIAEQSQLKKLEIERALTAKQIELSGIQAALVENQKKINEAEKALNALLVILPATSPLIIKVKATHLGAISERDVLSEKHNLVTAEMDSLYVNLITISQLVR